MKNFIKFLYKTGHFWNKEYPDTLNISLKDIDKLSLDDKIVKMAVKSYQESDINLTPLVRVFHSRDPIIDGEIGPATLALSTLNRCMVPDHIPPKTDLTEFDQEIQQIILSMQGSGSWPVPGCDPNRTDVHSIRVGIDTSRCPNKVKDYLNEALDNSVLCYAEIGLRIRYILDGNDKVEISKRFESLAGSVIGWNELPRGGTCNQTLEGRLDTGFTPDMKLWANLEVHETGHGVGLQHTRGHIMNPSINLIWPLSWKDSPSESTLKKYFGGEPLLLDKSLFKIIGNK